jgi:hypothetical protein
MTTTPRLWNSLTQVNTSDGGAAQSESKITPLQDGGYIVVWTDLSHTYNPLGEAIVGQRYDAAGHKVVGNSTHGGEIMLSQFTNGDQFSPAITTLANGNIAVAFVDLFTGNNNIYVRVFDPSLNFLREDDIDLGPNQTVNPALAAFADGSYAVSYTLTEGSNTFIEGRIVSATGEVGGQFDIDRRNDVRNDKQDFSHVEMLSNGNFVVLDQGLFNNVATNTDIRFGIFTEAGTPVLTNEPVPGGATIAAESQGDVAALHGGGFVVIWREPHDVDSSEIRAASSATTASPMSPPISSSTPQQDRIRTRVSRRWPTAASWSPGQTLPTPSLAGSASMGSATRSAPSSRFRAARRLNIPTAPC